MPRRLIARSNSAFDKRHGEVLDAVDLAKVVNADHVLVGHLAGQQQLLLHVRRIERLCAPGVDQPIAWRKNLQEVYAGLRARITANAVIITITEKFKINVALSNSGIGVAVTNTQKVR